MVCIDDKLINTPAVQFIVYKGNSRSEIRDMALCVAHCRQNINFQLYICEPSFVICIFRCKIHRLTKTHDSQQKLFVYYVNAPQTDLSKHPSPPNDFTSQYPTALALAKLAASGVTADTEQHGR